MNKEVEIKMAEMVVGKGDLVITTSSIGSCIAVVIMDKPNQIGGMAHAMLPHEKKESSDPDAGSKAKYVDTAIEHMVQELVELGADRKNLNARLVGGARMFSGLGLDNQHIGASNIEAAHQKLQELGIPIKSEDTGGTIGRLAKVSLSSGVLDVQSKM